MVSNPTLLWEGNVKCLICVGTSLPSTRPFGSSLAFGLHGNSEVKGGWARAILGWVTYWEVAREFPETKP